MAALVGAFEAPSPPSAGAIPPLKGNCIEPAVVVAAVLPSPPLKPNMDAVAVVVVTDVVTAGCAVRLKPPAPPKLRPTSKNALF